MSVEDRLSAGTNGVRSSLPSDFPVEFIRPPSPERVFEDGPHACLLADEDDRLSFAEENDDDSPIPSGFSHPGEDDSVPSTWIDAKRRLAAVTKRLARLDEENEGYFGEFKRTSKDCIANMKDAYQRK